MATMEHGDMLQSKLDAQDESVRQRESNIDLINNCQELSYFDKSQKYGTYQTNSNMFVQYGNQTEYLCDELSSDFVEPPITETLQSEATSYGGLLLVWGCGEFGQHGHGHTEDVQREYAIGSPLWLGQDRTVVEVSCGSSHTLVLTDDNKVYSWGNSNSGQLGTGGTETCVQPRLVHMGVSSGTKLKGITCGTRHSFIWTQDGDCFSFGNNYSGQLGYDFRKPDFKENQLRPVFVDTLLHRPVSQVACGSRHSVFLFTNGQVAAVGVNNRGQIGCGDTVDVVCAKTIPEIPPVSMIACGNSHTLAADVHGHVYAWGYGKACGSKTDILSPSCVYSCTELQYKIVDMAGGDSHSLILLSSGTIYSWGNNFEGQLGQGKSLKFVSHPRELSFNLLPGKVTSMSIGENTCAAVTDDGMLYMWGKNSNHMIRDDQSGRFFQFEPYLVSLGVWKVVKVSCGSWHVACVVFAAQKREINEVDQEISETATIITNSELETERLPSIGETEGKQFVKEEQFQKALLTLEEKPAVHLKERTYSDTNEGHSEEKPSVVDSKLKTAEDDTEKPAVFVRIPSENYVDDGGEQDPSKEQSRTNVTLKQPANEQGHKQFVKEEQFQKALANDPPSKEGFRVNKNKEKEQLFANNLIAGEGSEAKDASLEPFDASRDYYLDTQNREKGDDSDVEDFNNKADADVETKAEIIGDVTCKKSTAGSKNAAINFSFEEKPAVHLKEKMYSDTNEGINEEKPSVIDRMLKTAEDCDTEKPAGGDSGEQKRTNVKINQSANEQGLCIGKEECKVALEQQPSPGPFTRTRAFSEQASSIGSPSGSRDNSFVLHSGSLDNITFIHQQENKGRASRPSRVAYSPPANPRSSEGHLTREKRAPRMLRQSSFNVEYQLPNQPVHTVDIAMSPTVLRQGYPSLNRTQSSPSLYSSNLIRSPLGARKKSSLGNKVPRPPTVSTGTDDSLPPRPPARGIRRTLEFNPMFSSGASWRKR